jgi:hypothetical protein
MEGHADGDLNHAGAHGREPLPNRLTVAGEAPQLVLKAADTAVEPIGFHDVRVEPLQHLGVGVTAPERP